MSVFKGLQSVLFVPRDEHGPMQTDGYRLIVTRVFSINPREHK